MKHIILSVILSVLTTASSAFGQQFTTVNMADDGVRIMGRALMENGSATFGFPGQEIELRFSGSSSVKLVGEVVKWESFFNVYIDGAFQPKVNVREGKYTLTLADNLDPKTEHLVRVVRSSEACMGIVRVDSFELDTGAKILPPTPLPTRKILAIGDSITCGLNTELVPPATTSNELENPEHSYAWQLAKDYNAQVHLVSYSGRGLMRDWRGLNTALAQEILNEGGAVGKTLEIVTTGDFFERTLPDDKNTAWDHSQYQPDLILICLGQNDFCQIEIPPSEYAAAYIKFIDRVHEVYPKAHIVVMSSPMAETSREDGWMAKGKALELAISIMDQHYIMQGNPIVMPIFVSHQPGTVVDTHPTSAQQRALANELKPIIKFLTGWQDK